ncbi:hypothetical protein ACUN24_20540 [Pedobacter sp. WC2501]|uniref:hypothetical protein n=1 Tax=Pedobacter sp. WC2501 TaxID=3461400 RepID=UPI004045D9A7
MLAIESNNTELLPLLEFILKLLGGIGAFYLFLIGLKRYGKDQKWKRNEFVAAQAKEFNADKLVRNTMYMLDWGSRYVELFPESPVYAERFAKVTRGGLRSALQSHTTKRRFTPVEVAIRDHFDCFLNYFEVFEQYIEAGLISEKELEPYLRYWVQTISDDIEQEVRNSIHHYVDEYGFRGTQSLFRRFGKEIVPVAVISRNR